MSAGGYTTVGYVATYNNENIHPITVQPETLTLSLTFGNATVTNTGTDIDEVNNPISAVVSRGRRSRGLNARKITVQFTATPPTNYQANGIVTVPIVNPALSAAPRGLMGLT